MTAMLKPAVLEEALAQCALLDAGASALSDLGDLLLLPPSELRARLRQRNKKQENKDSLETILSYGSTR
jgi:hypothetical protein